MKRVWNYAMSMWQPVGALVIGAILVVFLFVFRLGSLAPGSTPAEITTQAQSSSIKAILDNPINAPYKTAQFLVNQVHGNVVTERLISAVIATVAIILFYILAKHFSGRFAAGLSTIMFATSTALLHNARFATPAITVLLLLLLFACGFRLRFNSHRKLSWVLAALLLGVSLYTPGMIYFVLAGAIWQFRAIKRSFDLPNPVFGTATIVAMLVLLVPLGLGIFHHPDLWREYLLIPKVLPHIKNFFLQLLAVPAGMIAFAPKNAFYRLGRQPVLDSFAAVMFIVGLYTLAKRYKLDRLPLFGGIFALGAVLTAISGNYEYSFVLVPFVYLVISMGLSMLLGEWRKTFPYNPLARSMALVIIALTVVVSCNFQLRRYFIAWPHSDETRAAFEEPSSNLSSVK